MNALRSQKKTYPVSSSLPAHIQVHDCRGCRRTPRPPQLPPEPDLCGLITNRTSPRFCRLRRIHAIQPSATGFQLRFVRRTHGGVRCRTYRSARVPLMRERERENMGRSRRRVDWRSCVELRLRDGRACEPSGFCKREPFFNPRPTDDLLRTGLTGKPGGSWLV
jgi:hypothetical protein